MQIEKKGKRDKADWEIDEIGRQRGWIGARLTVGQRVREVGLWQLVSRSAKVEGGKREKMRESKEREGNEKND